MFGSLAAALILGNSANPPKGNESARAVLVGWHDEMNEPRRWQPIVGDVKLQMSSPKFGLISLNLGPVSQSWPYEYQWSGATQVADVDVASFPILMARVGNVEGYAHLDVEVLDAAGNAFKNLRSTSLTKPGIVRLNLSEELDPATYHIRLRLIVGGSNSGCTANYTWLRFVAPADEEFLVQHPDYQTIKISRGHY